MLKIGDTGRGRGHCIIFLEEEDTRDNRKDRHRQTPKRIQTRRTGMDGNYPDGSR